MSKFKRRNSGLVVPSTPEVPKPKLPPRGPIEVVDDMGRIRVRDALSALWDASGCTKGGAIQMESRGVVDARRDAIYYVASQLLGEQDGCGFYIET